MPNLRCPSCYYSTTFRKDLINDQIRCSHCDLNLYTHYYSGRDEKHIGDFIYSENQRLQALKAAKHKAEREAWLNTAIRHEIDINQNNYSAYEKSITEIDNGGAADGFSLLHSGAFNKVTLTA